MSPASNRYDWLDISKGIGIVLVVIGHVAEGLLQAGLPDGESLHPWIQFIYSFHMPLFFIISGYLFSPSYEKNPGKFIPSKLKSLVYPYLLWSVLQTGIEIFLSKYTNKGIGMEELYSILWQPRAHFWYLHALFIISLINFFASQMLGKKGIGLSFMVWAIFASGLLSVELLKIPVHNILYFNAGILFWRYREEVGNLLRKKSALALIFLVFATAEYFLLKGFSRYYFNIFLAFTGAVFIFSLSRLNLPGIIHSSLKYLGKNSLYIYLAHVLTGSGVRIILQKFIGIESVSLHLALGCIAGILIPLMMVEIAEKTGCMFIFHYPEKTQKITDL